LVAGHYLDPRGRDSGDLFYATIMKVYSAY
jgi:hypothetical protein